MRLLLVEDDSTLRTQLKAAFEDAGYAVDGADNGLDARHLGETEPCDAAVLDLQRGAAGPGERRARTSRHG